MPVNSREKGAEYERKIAAAFRRTLGLEKNQVFRTPLSGGHEAAAAHHPGDLQFRPESLDHRLNLAVECKHWAEARVKHLLTGDGAYWDQWLMQAAGDIGMRRPVVIARVERMDLAVFPWDPSWIAPRPPYFVFPRPATCNVYGACAARQFLDEVKKLAR